MLAKELKEICVVLLCNKFFFDRMLKTLNEIRNHNYEGDVCIVIGDDLVGDDKIFNNPLLKVPNTYIKYFPDIKFDDSFMESFNSLSRDYYWTQKIFQYHKFHLFNKFFKNWNYIFYIDSGTHVFRDIKPIIDSRKPGKFLAHSDAYPSYQWKLKNQFDSSKISTFKELSENFNLEVDYPQTTIFLYDTIILKEETFDELLELTNKYNISITNDQGIIALYMVCIRKCWEQIKLGDQEKWFYDYLLRPEKSNKPHIMLKRF